MPIKSVTRTPKFDQLVKSIRDREVLKEASNEATNAFSRENTQTCKLFQQFLLDEKLPAGTVISVDEVPYKWDVAESEVIDPRRWYEAYTGGVITLDQFFSALSVGKDKAKLIAGEDQIFSMLTVARGTKADIRADYKNKTSHKDVQVIVPEPVLGLIKKPVQTSALAKTTILGRKLKIGR